VSILPHEAKQLLMKQKQTDTIFLLILDWDFKQFRVRSSLTLMCHVIKVTDLVWLPLILLQSEKPERKCASFALWQKATIEFTCHDHSIIACSCHIYIFCCSSHTSLSWWITQSTQHNGRGCNNTPSFLQRTAQIARSLCEGWTRHDLHILVTAPFCCDRKPEGQVRKASHCGSKQQ